jgi:hypothetical protein
MVAWIVSLWILSISPPIKEWWAHSPNAHTHRKKTSIKKERKRGGGETALSATYMAAKVGALRAVLRWWEEQKEEELGASRGSPIVLERRAKIRALLACFPHLITSKLPLSWACHLFGSVVWHADFRLLVARKGSSLRVSFSHYPNSFQLIPND